MNWKRNPIFLVFMVIVFLLAACSPAAQVETDKPTVTVSILPQQYFVERIAGAYFAVNVMVQPGESPATYEPTAQQMRDLSESAAYISIGVPFEQVWLSKIADANSTMLMVDSAAGIERLPLAEHHHDEDEHEVEVHEEEHEEGEHEDEAHEEGALDPHIWMSPSLVKVQAENIYAALVKLAPEQEAAFKANLDAFIADIDALDAEISETVSGLVQDEFMIFHPSMGYFAADYGLKQIPIEVGGTEPSAQELAALIDTAKETGVKVVFVQPEFSKKSAETIAQEIGGTVAELSILAPDWLDNMRRITTAFVEAAK